ncbi:MAG: hypothetical protein AB1733_24975 [Thermodesulfobacteriota bacterium]
MITSLKPYPAYKDSGVPWLGKVPEHWTVRRLKSVVAHINELTNAKHPDDLYIAMEHVESWTGRLRAPSGDIQFNSQVKRFRAGDVLFGKLRPYLAKVIRPHQHGVCVGEFFVLRSTHVVISPYLEAALRSAPVIHYVDSSTFGAKMPRADWTFVGNMFFPLPPLPEQTAIVRFLDYMDRRVRRYIRAKQKLIKLLEENRQALIHRAVTGQIDVRTGQPYPAYKDSGIEWLGKVPAHWEVVPIKRAFSSMDYGISESGSNSGTIRLLTMGHVRDGQVMIPDTGGVETVDSSLLLSRGDLLFNRTNSAVLVGKVALFSGNVSPVTFSSYLVRMRPTKENEPEFLNLVLNDASTLSRARREAIPSLHQSNLNPTRYGRLPVVLPPKLEQKAILQQLREQTNRIKAAISSARREIDLLREYRERLIADVVTGKVDVREVAARLPEEPPEEEAALEEIDETVEDDASGEESDAETVEEGES